MTDEVTDGLAARLGGRPADLRELVLAVSRIPYGRADPASAAGVVASWRGTCSTKHVLLRDAARVWWPSTDVEVWHRPYRVTRDLAARNWGDRVAAAVPGEGLMDVHTFATVNGAGERRIIDVTFPIDDWDGFASLPLACGAGEDVPAGDDVMASKAALVARHCDPTVREPFIAALSEAARS